MEIRVTEEFLRSAKPLAKKYRSFNQDYQRLLEELESNPCSGTDLGYGFRKVRMAISSKGKGKSGGARVISLNMLERNGVLFLLYIYDKSDFSNVEMAIIKDLAAKMGL